MQFVENGPDIPDALLQAHEEGRVVFFCGAGISYPAGLPLFKGLVEQVYEQLGTSQTPDEKAAFESWQFDLTLNRLERRYIGGRTAARQAVADKLQPKLDRQGATETHQALLRLARTQGDCFRLVTTNFDRIFDTAADIIGHETTTYSAPLLPTPRNGQWDGLVYLHGRLPGTDGGSRALNDLVLTSSDFGRAYLTERWAARFVSELFRNYVICFVGYSLNDPVMRYMMDALAADRIEDDNALPTFAFSDYKTGNEAHQKNRWEAQGITPVLYPTDSEGKDHSTLHNSLQAWAEIYHDGINGKAAIVARYATVEPLHSTAQDNFVSRMIWALSDSSGYPAKCLADHEPLPSLAWLEYFYDSRNQQEHRNRLGTHPQSKNNERAFQFTLLNRPAPYQHAARISPFVEQAKESDWDNVMSQLGRWLARYLHDPALLLWLSRQSLPLHPQLLHQIESRLHQLSQPECDTQHDHMPNPQLQTLWRLVLTGHLKGSTGHRDLFNWKDRLTRYGLTPSLRHEFRALLAPQIKIRDFQTEMDATSADGSQSCERELEWALVLASDQVGYLLEPDTDVPFRKVLPKLVGELEQLLQDALDLYAELDSDDGQSDPSSWILPSLDPSQQYHSVDNWVLLIKLLRDAWVQTHKEDALRAQEIAENWFEQHDPAFRRLALFAAGRGAIAADQWADWLLKDNACHLWSPKMGNEAMNLIIAQGKELPSAERDRLEAIILEGDPRASLHDTSDESTWPMGNRPILTRLYALQQIGHPLGNKAKQQLDNLLAEYKARLPCPVEAAPRHRAALIRWLETSSADYPFSKDGWRELCQARPSLCISALRQLANKDQWPTQRWSSLLSALSGAGNPRCSWKVLDPLMGRMPGTELQQLLADLSFWLKGIADAIESNEADFLALCQRVLQQSTEELPPIRTLLTTAINHPAGHITGALVTRWLRRKPVDNQRLPDDIAPLFSEICNAQNNHYRHGRIQLASQLIALYRVDRQWTTTHLLSFFDWKHPEAAGVWQGFLRAPRLYRPLLVALKPQLLEAAQYYDQLEEFGEQYASFLTFLALEGVEGFKNSEFADAFLALPQDGLEASALALVQFIKGAGDQPESYWRNRIEPFWQSVWPKSNDAMSDKISSSLAQLCVASGDAFPTTVNRFRDWFLPLEHPNIILVQLSASTIIARYPEPVLGLISQIVEHPARLPRNYRNCLDAIINTEPSLKLDSRFLRLNEIWQLQT